MNQKVLASTTLFVAIASSGCVAHSQLTELSQTPPQSNLTNAAHVQHEVNAANDHVPIATLGRQENLAQILDETPVNVLLDFYADWCGPCKRQAKVLHGLTQSESNKPARIIKVNVDEHPELARQFQVTSLPTLVLVRNNSVVDQLTGFNSAQRVNELLQR